MKLKIPMFLGFGFYMQLIFFSLFPLNQFFIFELDEGRNIFCSFSDKSKNRINDFCNAIKVRQRPSIETKLNGTGQVSYCNS